MFPYLVQVGWRPVKPNAFILFRYWFPRSLIEPEKHTFMMDHAAHQPAVFSHFAIRRKTKTFNPKAQAFFQISTGDYGHTVIDIHKRLFLKYWYFIHHPSPSR